MRKHEDDRLTNRRCKSITREFEILVTAGRGLKTGHGFRGALIQLEGDKAYLTNVRRSILYQIQFPSSVGTGTFYSVEAPINAERIERRDNRVVFDYTQKGITKQIFIPDKASIKEMSEEILKRFYHKPDTPVPMSFLDELNPDFPITDLTLKDNAIIISQKRGDGSVELRTKINLNFKSGFDELLGGSDDVDVAREATVSFFTRDLTDLKTTITGDLELYLETGKPISIKASMEKATIIGVIGDLSYD